jgi:hypothetical protein
MILSENATLQQYEYEIKHYRRMFEILSKQKQPFVILNYYWEMRMDLIRESNKKFGVPALPIN